MSCKNIGRDAVEPNILKLIARPIILGVNHPILSLSCVGSDIFRYRTPQNMIMVNTGTFLVYQYYQKNVIRSSESASVIQKPAILKCKIGLVLSNNHVLVSGTFSTLLPNEVQ